MTGPHGESDEPRLGKILAVCNCPGECVPDRGVGRRSYVDREGRGKGA